VSADGAGLIASGDRVGRGLLGARAARGRADRIGRGSKAVVMKAFARSSLRQSVPDGAGNVLGDMKVLSVEGATVMHV
jgi:hypothetical protein